MSELRLETWRMPAAGLGPESPLPPLPGPSEIYEPSPPIRPGGQSPLEHAGYGLTPAILPYALQDDYDRDLQPRAFTVGVLENDVLRATFLLELGARLWSLRHKPSGRELLDVNPVFQPANLAIRNAWFSGGIEWNVSMRGHAAHTCSPLSAARLAGRNGQPILRLYEWERLRGVPFQIDFSLPDGSAFLYACMRLVNPHAYTIPMYWWSNMAVPETPDTRVLAPADAAFLHTYRGPLGSQPMPAPAGVDLSRPGGVPHCYDIFFDIARDQRRWVTALDETGAGLVQTSTRRLTGRKLFAWGAGAGGRRWQEFLSQPGRAYIEIQAGLAQTQDQCLPMAAAAEWSWVEAYGLMTADPTTVHGDDWQAAWGHVGARLEELLPPAVVAQADWDSGRTLESAPIEMLQLGSGWGALERRRREKAGEKPFASAAMPFGDDSLGPDQEPWLQLLDRGSFPDRPTDVAPGPWLVQPAWRALLEEAVGGDDHWLAWLHLGVMYCHAGLWATARAAWEKSLACCPSGWAWRNLAVLEAADGNAETAAAHWRRASEMLPSVPQLAAETCRALVDAGQADRIEEFAAGLAPAAQQCPRLQICRIQAALEIDRIELAGQLLEALAPVDLREGEESLSELWYRFQEKRLAVADGVALDDALRQRVRRELPPPARLNFVAAATG